MEANKNLKVEDLFYPSAINWMWNYCINLGKFTDSRGNNYDLGIHISEWVYNGKPSKEVSAAIVCSDRDGDYYSGEIMESRYGSNPELDWTHEKYRETYKRAKERKLI